MSHYKLGQMINVGLAFGVITKEARKIPSGKWHHELVEVTWLNGKRKGTTEDMPEWRLTDSNYDLGCRKHAVREMEDRIAKANTARKLLGV